MTEESEHVNQKVPGIAQEEDTSHDSLDEKSKPKKVIGVGLGNIFDGTSITLRRSGTDVVAKSEEAPHPLDNMAEATDEKDKSLQSDVAPPEASKEKKSTNSVSEKALVLFSYKAEHDDELELIEGEEVIVLQKEIEDPGWYRGESHGKTGVFPDNFVKLIPSQRPRKPPPPSREVLARSTHMGNGTPPPTIDSPMSQSTDNVSSGTDTAPADNNKPPPLPPKDVNLIGPKPGKLGLGAIPNLSQIRNMLKTSSAVTSPDGPGRSLFYIAAPSADGDPTLLIVPEQGATVTTVLFHPTKDRARGPAKRHERRRAVKFDESTISSNHEAYTPFHPQNNENAYVSVENAPSVSPQHVPHSVAPSQSKPHVDNKVLHVDNKPQIPAVVAPSPLPISQPVWEKRNSPEPAASPEQRYQQVDSDTSNSGSVTPVPAPAPVSSTLRRQPPAVPSAAKKPPPPIAPKKAVLQQAQQRSSMEIKPIIPSSAPEPSASLPVAANIAVTSDDTTSKAKETVVKTAAPKPVTAEKSPSPEKEASAVAAVNARCDRLDRLVQDLRRDLTSAQNDVRRLTVELDEEKKARLGDKVDLERLRKIVTTPPPPVVPCYPPPQPPIRPPPPPQAQQANSDSEVLETTKI